MSETREKCIDLAEFYDIDWYAGEFRESFAVDGQLAEELLQRLTTRHHANIAEKLSWSDGRAEMLGLLGELQQYDPSTSQAAAATIHWLEGDDPEMIQAIGRAQQSIGEFVQAVESDQQ